MEYKFQILTTEGTMESTVGSDSDFSCAPFGYVPYRFVSTCDCSQEVLDDFWRCVDEVLQNNNLTSEHYIRTIRAIDNDDKIFGENLNNNLNSSQNSILPNGGPPNEWIQKWD